MAGTEGGRFAVFWGQKRNLKKEGEKKKLPSASVKRRAVFGKAPARNVRSRGTGQPVNPGGGKETLNQTGGINRNPPRGQRGYTYKTSPTTKKVKRRGKIPQRARDNLPGRLSTKNERKKHVKYLCLKNYRIFFQLGPREELWRG